MIDSGRDFPLNCYDLLTRELQDACSMYELLGASGLRGSRK